MNEQIKELAEQSGIHLDNYGCVYDVVDDNIEKFAELLLAEYAAEYKKLCDGDSVVLPKTREHAEAMVRVGMFYLEHSV